MSGTDTNPVDPDDEVIAAAIQVAETETSGEIRVFLSRHLCENPAQAARQEFVRLEMTHTPLRNAVLLYVAPKSGAFAVACDEGVQFRCPPEFEQTVTAAAMPALLEGRVEQAILSAIRTAAECLSQCYPPFALDRNDLPNAPIRD